VRFWFDLSFFILVIIIIIQNSVFGVIINTFADLHMKKNKEEDMTRNTCFICGESRRDVRGQKKELRGVSLQHTVYGL